MASPMSGVMLLWLVALPSVGELIEHVPRTLLALKRCYQLTFEATLIPERQ